MCTTLSCIFRFKTPFDAFCENLAPRTQIRKSLFSRAFFRGRQRIIFRIGSIRNDFIALMSFNNRVEPISRIDIKLLYSPLSL